VTKNIAPFTEASPLDEKFAHFETLVIASHLDSVAESIATFRKGLDLEGEAFFSKNAGDRRKAVLLALKDYFGVDVGFGALTHSTSMGLAQVLGGVKIARGQEILTSRNEHPATMETLHLRAERDGTNFRRVALFRDSRTLTSAEIVANLEAEIRPWTRVLALAWVYSSDGVKLPIKEIANVVARENRKRATPADRLLLIVDGLHGFGIENVNFSDLDCDFFIAGCHKSIFGPRGTGVICGKPEAWPQIVPFTARLSGIDEGPAARHIPGGVRCFEHWWAIDAAFRELLKNGKAKNQEHIHKLATAFKKDLSAIPGVTVVTPATPEFSSGMVCVDVRSVSQDRMLPPSDVITALRNKKVLASQSAYDPTAATTHVRFGVSLVNTENDTKKAVQELAKIAK
jgi:selenocysteine lyase/cysteine desulfurase